MAAEVRVLALRSRDPSDLDAAGIVFPRENEGPEIIYDACLLRRNTLQGGSQFGDGEVGIGLAEDRQLQFPVRRKISGFGLEGAGPFLRRRPGPGGKRLSVISE